jgi:hypothetical protein
LHNRFTILVLMLSFFRRVRSGDNPLAHRVQNQLRHAMQIHVVYQFEVQVPLCL